MKYGIIKFPVFISLIAVFSHCVLELGKEGGPSDSLTSEEIEDSLNLAFQFIQDSVFTPMCAPCHWGSYAPHGLRLTPDSTTDLVNKPSFKLPERRLVIPGSPDSSYLIWKLTARKGIAGAPMPNEALALKPHQIKVIRDWILLLGA